MNQPLRPMNLGEILDRAVQIFRLQPVLFFGLAAIPGVVQLASSLASAHQALTGLLRAGATFAMIFFVVVHLIVSVISSAAICLAASTAYLGGATTIGRAFGSFRGRKGRLVGLAFLQGLYAGWPMIVAIFVGGMIAGIISLASGARGAFLYVQGFSFAVAAIPCLALYARCALAFPVTAVEGLPASASIERSVSLSNGGRMRICMGIVVPSVPALVITYGSIALIGHFKAYSPLLAGSPLGVAIISGFVGFLVTLIFSPYGSIVLTLLYYDQRIRREGYDVETMMVAAGLNPNAAQTPDALPMPALDLPATAQPIPAEGNQQA